MRALLKEPLLHFLLLGAALFAVYELVEPGSQTRPGAIVVSAVQVEQLASRFARLRQRPPTTEELKGLIDQYVREEILSREAVKLGLDRDDVIIRQRLQQKMEFVATDVLTMDEPAEAELAAWLADHPNDFRREPRFSLRHVYLRPDKRGEHIDKDVARLLAELKLADADIDERAMGDSFLLPREFRDQPRSAIAAQLGPDFVAQLDRLQIGEWSGPVRSGYGVHLVLLTERSEGRLPALEEVREQVKRELMNARRVEANRRFLDELLAKYTVTVEWPKPVPSTAARMPGKSP